MTQIRQPYQQQKQHIQPPSFLSLGKPVADMSKEELCQNHVHLQKLRGQSVPEKSLLKYCPWCSRVRRFSLNSDRYCTNCMKKARPCHVCKRPLKDASYANANSITCLTCENRKTRQQGRGAEGNRSVFNGAAEVKVIHGGDDVVDWEGFLNDSVQRVHDMVKEKQERDLGVKFYAVLNMKFIKYESGEDGEEITTEAWLRHGTKTITNDSDIAVTVREGFDEIGENVRAFQREGSGWSTHSVVQMEIKMVSYKPLRARSYLPLPKCLKSKQALLNVENEDEECFKWCVLASVFTTNRDKHRERVGYLRQFENRLNFNRVTFPTSLADIDKFEKDNVEVSVNVYGYSEKEWVYPLRISSRANLAANHVNLLLFSEHNVQHYVVIVDMSNLFSKRTRSKNASYICNRCLHPFSSQRTHDSHLTYCLVQDAQRLDLPKTPDEKILKFSTEYKGLKVPYVLYADFESFLVPIQEEEENNGNVSFTTQIQKHIPASFCYYKVRSDNANVGQPVLYRKEAVVDKFYECLLSELSNIQDDLDDIAEMRLSREEEDEFHSAILCVVCGKELGSDRVRHHDHVSGRFFGATHNKCNLKMKFRKGTKPGCKVRLPVVIHNSKNYDTHLLMQGLGKFAGDLNVGCIENNSEKYISFNLGVLVFIDSMQFLNCSLAKLVENLEDRQFVHLSRFYPDDIDILRRKGVYPYDYFTGREVFEETQLPPKESFYSKLTEEDISDEDYAHASRVRNYFGMQSFAEYHDLYVKLDVLLLADVFENFRNFTLTNYGLDACHFLTSPSLSWCAMLRMTGVELELIDDMEQYMFIENGIRGGLTFIGKRYAKANHEHSDEFDISKDKTFISYLDANNLYGLAMTCPLPMGGFRFLTEQEVSCFDKHKILSLSDNSEEGFIFEVDLDYPQHLHGSHACYPMAPERMVIDDNMLSELQRELKEELQVGGSQVPKLVSTVLPKRKYIVHHNTLKLYLKHGLVLRHVHKILTFKQSRWLKPYIDFNSNMRKNATNSFDKSLFKLFNNCIYGKSMENVRNRCDVRLVSQQAQLEKLTANPRFKSFTIFNESLVGVDMRKAVVKATRPNFAGLVILEESKCHLFWFHHEVMKPFYGPRISLLYTDTDSLIYEIKTESLDNDYKKLMSYLDTSNYPEDHPLKTDQNKAVVGKFKDEMAGQHIEEFVGLKPKMYSIKISGSGKESKRAKGVARNHVKKCFKHNMYVDCLHNKSKSRCSFKAICSKKHEIHTYHISKIGLCCYDSKRYMEADGIHTLPFGHHTITD